jgi:hypothetical protein
MSLLWAEDQVGSHKMPLLWAIFRKGRRRGSLFVVSCCDGYQLYIAYCLAGRFLETLTTRADDSAFLP